MTGYLFLDRQHRQDAIIVFDTQAEANAALKEHPLVDALCQEDCLDLYVEPDLSLNELVGHLIDREVILA